MKKKIEHNFSKEAKVPNKINIVKEKHKKRGKQ